MIRGFEITKMKKNQNNKIKEIEIPIGVSFDGTDISMSLFRIERNHCYITGSVGSGKSTLLKRIIDSLVKNYSKDQVVVWTNLDYERCESVIKVCQPQNNYEIASLHIFNQLYDEAQRRMEILSHKGVGETTNVNSLPLLVAVIDNFSMFNFSDCCQFEFTAIKISDIMRMSHALGMIIICASQIPVSRFGTLSPVVDGLFNFRIALNSSRDFIIESLRIPSSEASAEVNAKIDSLLIGKTGDFLIRNLYEPDVLLAGQVRDSARN